MMIKFKNLAGRTPTARKLYQFAASRKLPTTIGTDDFRRLCGIDESAPDWVAEVERACLEAATAGIVKAAYVQDGQIHIQ